MLLVHGRRRGVLVFLIAMAGCVVLALGLRGSTPASRPSDPRRGGPVADSVPAAGPTCSSAVDPGTRGHLLPSQVWGSENAGHSATLEMLGRCGLGPRQAVDVTEFRCSLSFPWLSAAARRTQLYALGVQTYTLTHLQRSSTAAVDQTVLSFAPGSRGGTFLRAKATECHDASLLIAGSGRSVTAVTFSDPSLGRKVRARILRAATRT